MLTRWEGTANDKRMYELSESWYIRLPFDLLAHLLSVDASPQPVHVSVNHVDIIV